MKMRRPLRAAGRSPSEEVARGGDVNRDERLWLGDAEDEDPNDFEDDDDLDDDDDYDDGDDLEDVGDDEGWDDEDADDFEDDEDEKE